MPKTSPGQNKALVLEAFDALFNRRDYDAAERFWSDRYIQHSAHIAPGRDGLFNLVRTLPDTLKYEPAHRRRRRLRDRARALLRHWPTRRLGRRRHRPHRGRQARRALGRAPGRGDQGSISQWLADVRRPVPRLTYRIRPRSTPAQADPAAARSTRSTPSPCRRITRFGGWTTC